MTASTCRTAAAARAREAATKAMLERIQATLKQMRRERARITIAAVARRADVSRTFLYQNPQARSLVADASASAADGLVAADASRVERIEASWRERALNAEDALVRAYQEVTNQRTAIAGLLGQIRDLEADLPEDGVQRLITENTTLKQTVRRLTQENQRFGERLQGARDNNRFLDRRIAELEMQVIGDVTS